MSISLKHTTELFHKDHSPPPTIEGLNKTYTYAYGNIQSLTSLRFLAVLCVVFNHGKTFFHCWQDFDYSLNLSQAVCFFINPLARLLEFIVGILAAIAFKHSVHKIKVSRLQATLLELSLIALIVTISLNSNSWSITVSQHLSAALGEWLRNSGLIMVPFALLIGILSLQRGNVSQALRFPFLLTLGESSFAIYMLHVVLLTHRSVRFPQDQSFGASLMYLSLLILTAHLFTTLIERPLRKLTTNIRDYRFRIAVPNLVLCKMLILLLVISLGFPKAQALSSREAEYNASGALVRNIDFLPEVRCVSAVARHDRSFTPKWN